MQSHRLDSCRSTLSASTAWASLTASATSRSPSPPSGQVR